MTATTYQAPITRGELPDLVEHLARHLKRVKRSEVPEDKRAPAWNIFRKYWHNGAKFQLYIPRYDDYITCVVGYYDGSSGGLDDMPEFWVPHDNICWRARFDSGRPITSKMARQISIDLIKAGAQLKSKWVRPVYSARAYATGQATYIFGCKKTRENDE